MSVHQGLRLKNFIEKSNLRVTEISEKSNVPMSSLYDMYKKPEILRSKIAPILKAIDVDIDVFYGLKPTDNEGLQQKIDALTREIALLREQLAAKDEIIQLLKRKSNGR